MSTPATLPQAVWTSKVLPAPKTSDALAQIAHFLEQLGYAKTVKALRKEAEANEATFTTTGWPNSADGPFARTLGDLYVDAFLEEFSDEESEKSDSDDSSSSDEAEQELTQAAVSGTKRKREVSVSSESEDSDSSSAASSSSEDSDSDSDEDSDTEPAAKRTKIEEMAGKTLDSAGDLDSDDSSSDSESSESDDSSSASDSSESDDSSDTDDESEDADSEKASKEESSDSDSDTSSDSSESEEEETVVAPVIPDKKSKKALLKQKSAKEDESASSASSATLIASPVPAETNAIESSMHPARQQRLDNDNRPALNKNGKGNVPFSRIPKDTQVDPRFASNEYVSYDYADRAYQDLVVTKGKGFTKEKNKKKRGSYRGGAIDIAPKGIKFDD